ncbi:hypothetical protein PHLGIDRAFT_11961 [Phlebiopsis gigantea 11061_1 CR5-6]|uniref:DUF159-domain-containing protein n=1 Tax=Phlebiopsis gigantea (strain 11061_1 CR5-6) TaxID=745531 RepID=A0A0C3S2E2_PHLG1|nr:hypothetical protein PHLGIDRAFT_11961 [Phlebiopsis gigantea 11061_1 CR5-6]
MDGYNIQIGEWVDQDDYQPRHNVAPRSRAPVVRRRRDSPADASVDASSSLPDELILHTMKWGLVPHWSKYEDLRLNTINARKESLVEGSGIWMSLRGRKRCAIPCEGYYEWLKKGKERLPHFTKRNDGRLLLLAGLYDSVLLEGHTQVLFTFTIITTEANTEFGWLHDRQPVILSTEESLNLWLDTTNHEWDPQIADLLEPYHDQEAPLLCYQVPKEVGKVGNESPTFVQPISERKDGIQAMFSRQAQKPPASPSSSQIKLAPITPTKRKRDASPLPSLKLTPKRLKSPSKSQRKVKDEKQLKAEKDIIDLCESDDTGTKTQKIDAWDDNEIECINPPSSSQEKYDLSPQ